MISNEATDKYLKEPFNCPYCGSDRLKTSKIKDAGIEKHIPVVCQSCKRKWKDVYKFSSSGDGNNIYRMINVVGITK